MGNSTDYSPEKLITIADDGILKTGCGNREIIVHPFSKS